MPHLDTLAYSHTLTTFYILFLFLLIITHNNINNAEGMIIIMQSLHNNNWIY